MSILVTQAIIVISALVAFLLAVPSSDVVDARSAQVAQLVSATMIFKGWELVVENVQEMKWYHVGSIIVAGHLYWAVYLVAGGSEADFRLAFTVGTALFGLKHLIRFIRLSGSYVLFHYRRRNGSDQ